MVGKEDKRTNNRIMFPALKKQCSCRLSGSSENRTFERCRSTLNTTLGTVLVRKAFKELTFGERVSSEGGGWGRERLFTLREFAFQNWLDLNWLELTGERKKRTVQIKE